MAWTQIQANALDLSPTFAGFAAWEEAGNVFSEREQAALALTEQVILISEQEATDEVVHLLMAISAINVWNRMNVTAKTAVPGEDV